MERTSPRRAGTTAEAGRRTRAAQGAEEIEVEIMRRG